MNEPHQGLPPPPGGGLLLGLPQLLILFPVLTPSDHRPHPHHPAPSLHAQNGVPQEGTEQRAQQTRRMLKQKARTFEGRRTGRRPRGRESECATTGEVKTPANRWARPRGGAAIFAVAASNPGTGFSFRALSPQRLQLVKEIANFCNCRPVGPGALHWKSENVKLQHGWIKHKGYPPIRPCDSGQKGRQSLFIARATQCHAIAEACCLARPAPLYSVFLGPLNLFPAHIKTVHSSSIVSSPPTPFPVVGFLHLLALMLFADSFLASSKVSFPLISVVFPSRSSFLSAVYSFSFFSLCPLVSR